MGSLLRRDTVSWDRKQDTGTTDDLGHPVKASATGYPQTVRGHFQHDGASGNQAVAGLDQTIGATFVSDTWYSGAIGDEVTKDGVTYTVTNVSASDRASGVRNHARYTLVRASTGATPHGV